MLRLCKTFLLVLIVGAMVATACRADVGIDQAGSQGDPVGAQTPDEDPSAPPPTPADEPADVDPTAAPEPADQSNDEAPADFDPLSGIGPEFTAPADWAELLPVDPGVVEGTLDTGMRYLIRNNQAPGGQAQLRLAVQAGSLNEIDGRLGAAHFLEHMMFNGTERFPGNDIVQVLEGFGSTFGPDVNAYTSFEETVYELTVPSRDTDTLQLALDVLLEWAGSATLDPDDVVAERGVVREELRRSAESVSGRLGEEVREVLFEGTDYLGREPIGLVEVIDSMTDEDLRVFYERWYRPELMTVIAVGDFDVGDMEQRIVDTFGDFDPDGESIDPLAVDDGDGPLPQPTFDVYTDSELNRSEVQVYWRLNGTAERTKSDVRAELVSSLTFTMLNQRLFEAVEGGEGVFVSAGGGLGSFVGQADIASLTGTTDPENTRAGLVELLTVAEQARQFGFSDAEFARAQSGIRSTLDQIFASRNTRQDEEYASALVTYGLGGVIPLSAEDTQEIATEVLDTITIDDSRRLLSSLLESNPYVLVTGPQADQDQLPLPEELAATYDDVVGSPVDEPENAASEVTSLLDPPEPADVVNVERIEALDATIVTYENGARLAYRRTTIVDNLISMRATSQGGFFAATEEQAPLLGRAGELVVGSGFESIDNVTLGRLLTGSIVSLNASVGRAEEILDGQASPADLETLFQLIYLQMTEPTISPIQVRQFDESWRPLAENPQTTPGVVADLELWSLRYGDSPYFRLIPTVEDLDALDPDVLLGAWRERFDNAGDFLFVFAGDLDAEELVDLGARYIGTLPSADVREEAVDRDPGVPEENLVSTVRAGVGDQGLVRINWESPYPFTIEADVVAQTLELVVDARLRDLIREELSASYSPNASVTVLSEPKPWVDTIIEVESDPDRVEEVSQAVRDELDRIRAGDIAPVYLELAVDQLIEDYRFFSNPDWISLITFHATNPDRAPSEYQRRIDIAESLVLQDIVDAAQIVFPPTRSVEVRLVPAS